MSDKEKKVTEIKNLQELGSELQKKREANNLSMQDYAEKLKIRHSYLLSIENGLPENLPGTVFYISFAKSYATALGLDGDDFASQTRKALQQKGLPDTFALPADKQQDAQQTNITRNTIFTAIGSSSSDGDSSKPSLAASTGKPTTLATLATLTTPAQKKQLATNEEALNKPALMSPLALPLASPYAPHLHFNKKNGLPKKLVIDAATEKQALRETMFSPMFVIGGGLAVVLLYLGSVIVTDLLGDREPSESRAERVTALDQIEEELLGDETLEELVAEEEPLYEPQMYGALGPTRVIIEAQEKCWIAVFATESEPGVPQDAELLFVGDLKAGDRYHVPVQLGVILKGGNLDALRFEVHGGGVEPFRIQNPSGFMSLEPVHLRNKTAIREGGALARERLPVVQEIELLREYRTKEALDK